MKVAGHHRGPDFAKLGTSLLIASCLILAVRTAKWPARLRGTNADPQLDEEVENSIHMAERVLARLLSHKEGLFPSKKTPWYEPDDSDVAL